MDEGGTKDALSAGSKKFFADAMLGRLATWMRALGYDVLYERHIEDGEIIKKALEEGRVIITRDTFLVKRRVLAGRAFLIASDHVREQIQEVALKFPPEPQLFLTRCLRCNTPLDEAPRNTVKDLVPPYVFKTQKSFARCGSCGRVYWAGTHRNHMTNELQTIIKDYGGE